MKHVWFVSIISGFLLSILAVLLFWLIQPTGGVVKAIFSPLPPFLTMQVNGQVRTINLWTLPSIADEPFATQPSLSATSVFSFDMSTNKALFVKNIHQRLPMASITKIMTAIIALENKKANDKYTVSPSALVGEDSMGLTEGEILSQEELLYGLILHSGNDAAEVLADNFPGGREAFTRAMNQKVASLGLTDTHFTNPTGLEGDGNQYTTASDLLVITHYALSNFPLFGQVAQTFDYIIPQTGTHKEFDLENETNLLTSYPGVKGIKTGYTPEAGLCLVTYLDYQGHQIIAVMLNSENRRDEMKQVLDYSLESIHITPPPHE